MTNTWEPQIDYNSKDWKVTYANLRMFDAFEARAIDLYNYSKMLVDTAQKLDLIDWYNYCNCNEESTWDDIPDIYSHEDLPMMYSRFNTMYQNARKGIVSLGARFENQLNDLAAKGMISNIKKSSSGFSYTFTVKTNKEI